MTHREAHVARRLLAAGSGAARRPHGGVAPFAAAAGLVLLGAASARAYPVDGETRTGIRRLQGNPSIPPGAMLAVADIHLDLIGKNEKWDLTKESVDPVLQAALASIFNGRDPSYGVAVIDITNPDDIAWAGLREDTQFYPGSVGKVPCMIALFDGLRRAFPDKTVREKILRETIIPADEWSSGDSHGVPKYAADQNRNVWSHIQPGETYALSEWLDHAISASANAAGAIVWREAILLRAFGSEYPGTKERRDAFLAQTAKAQLQALALQVIEEPLKEAGIDCPGSLRQGTMWTRYGKSRIPGVSSYGTPREWVRVLLRIEQGRMVDEWSSLEMKRYLYITRKRYRYCCCPELNEAAVFFKSGSLYACQKEPGFSCGKYRGNKKNLMNSICVIESPAKPCPEQKRYIVALMSNVLRKNSAWDHSRVGAAIEEAVRTRKPTAVRDAGTAAEIEAAGGGTAAGD